MSSRQAREELASLDEIGDRLETALSRATADETEIVWLETRRGSATRRGKKGSSQCVTERSILVRVLDRGRVGSYRTGSAEPGDLEDAVRQALAQSRVREPLSGLPHLPADQTPLAGPTELWDPEIAELEANRVRDRLAEAGTAPGRIDFRWAEGRVAVFNSRDVRRLARVTAAGCVTTAGGGGGGAGRASAASRRLADLDPKALFDRARQRAQRPNGATAPAGTLPVVLGPEAVIDLVTMLNDTSFQAKAYYDGTSFLREHVNVQVFDRRLDLVDDGTDASGIPFPFDLEGTAKRRVALIRKGAPKTPTLDQRQAAVLGLPATAHAIGGNNARAENLFVVGGEASEEELIADVGEGLWIGWLDPLECVEPRRVRFRSRARGVRRIEGGRLGAGCDDFNWNDSLLRAFSSLPAVGRESSARLSADGYLGAVSAPAIAVAQIEVPVDEGADLAHSSKPRVG